ncbi:redoxin family protein [Candidatus Nomurabacteria bacterium]|nr:redoxin family protein [Candidatus Nomurabacteria bacterium]
MISFIAGALTVLAPCILPLLPVIIGGSISESGNKFKPYIITGSLALSIVLFTLLLKASTAFISVSPSFWTTVSGLILIVFSVTMIFPGIWEKVASRFSFSQAGNRWLAQGSKKGGVVGDVVMGLALGPVFSSCSPTYFVILATVLPASFLLGLVYLISYSLGLSIVLLMISLLGQKFALRLGKLSDPEGWFKKIIGLLFLIVGLAILTGVDKKVESFLVERGFDFTGIEHKLLEQTEKKDMMGSDMRDKSSFPDYVEITNPSGFVNTEPIQIADFVGKKVILIDFMTYSCINCQRTFPYLNEWYEKYKDDGLVIIGIHTPEFAFEREIDNVKVAMEKEGIQFPIVLDNDYGTWRAYGNKYWPRKYLIDVDGKIVYDHIGEGKYDETEEKIVELLSELNDRKIEIEKGELTEKDEVDFSKVKTRETYLGANRVEYLANLPNTTCLNASCSYFSSGNLKLNTFELQGQWKLESEEAILESETGSIFIRFSSNKVNLVAGGDSSAQIYLDGQLISKESSGKEVIDSKVSFTNHDLYNLVDLQGNYGEHLLEIRLIDGEFQGFAFTFG